MKTTLIDSIECTGVSHYEVILCPELPVIKPIPIVALSQNRDERDNNCNQGFKSGT
jgi:hypothetical protein